MEQILLTRIFKQMLNFIKSYIEELLSIFLLPNIGRLAVKWLETEAEGSRVVVLAVRELEETKHIHHLMQEVVIDI